MKFNQLIIQALFLTIGMGCFSVASAGYVQQVEIRALYVGGGYAHFGKLGTTPSNTCNYFNRLWRFNVTTPQGEALLKVLLTAQATNSVISVWYNDSTAPGTTHTNGCNAGTMAVPFSIGFYNG